MNWEMVTAVVALTALLGGFMRWVVQHVVRDELRVIRQDVDVLRVAVFNHLSHGDQPVEEQLREVMGYGERRR